MEYRFKTPDEFIAWLLTQSVTIQREAARVTLALTDMGIPGQEAAHLVYEAVTLDKAPTIQH
jgi:hypothetical protein